ncbi:hypothetical protein BLL42_27040 (plasmid) [Pseudomonas frederiksbergensis]|uniref:Uncharacterized protein n=1 Tax=Pseudomonas frederiksbergensis TaxID=104087 RepID=A0A1J0ETS8_9PSED|nr:hypothetical protein [Pseudomonas frederiksbergensis]APC19398.1 hypothetical protein BLL42_27040 [Pseudomonas frederiksbergensis]
MTEQKVELCLQKTRLYIAAISTAANVVDLDLSYGQANGYLRCMLDTGAISNDRWQEMSLLAQRAHLGGLNHFGVDRVMDYNR